MFKTKVSNEGNLFVLQDVHFKADFYKFKAMMNSKNKLKGISLFFATCESHLVDV